MMKKLIVLGIVATMVMGFAVVAQAAYDTDWVINIKAATDAAGTAAASTTGLRARGIYTDPKAAEDTVAPPAGAAPIVFVYSTIGADNLVNDFRGSFTGTEKVWNLTVGNARYGTAPETVYLFGWNPANTSVVTYNDFLPLGSETITLYNAPGGVRGTVAWSVSGLVNGNGGSADANTWKSGPIAMGSQYQLVVTVPEPGSMLAMLSGLVGLAGFAIRRKR